jgi:hypothetical protein
LSIELEIICGIQKTYYGNITFQKGDSQPKKIQIAFLKRRFVRGFENTSPDNYGYFKTSTTGRQGLHREDLVGPLRQAQLHRYRWHLERCSAFRDGPRRSKMKASNIFVEALQ